VERDTAFTSQRIAQQDDKTGPEPSAAGMKTDRIGLAGNERGDQCTRQPVSGVEFIFKHGIKSAWAGQIDLYLAVRPYEDFNVHVPAVCIIKPAAWPAAEKDGQLCKQKLGISDANFLVGWAKRPWRDERRPIFIDNQQGLIFASLIIRGTYSGWFHINRTVSHNGLEIRFRPGAIPADRVARNKGIVAQFGIEASVA